MCICSLQADENKALIVVHERIEPRRKREKKHENYGPQNEVGNVERPVDATTEIKRGFFCVCD